MSVTLETLEIAPHSLPAIREDIERMAYFLWLQAGSPECDSFEFWQQAERDWIEHYYVPPRPLNGARPTAEPADREAAEVLR